MPNRGGMMSGLAQGLHGGTNLGLRLREVPHRRRMREERADLQRQRLEGQQEHQDARLGMAQDRHGVFMDQAQQEQQQRALQTLYRMLSQENPSFDAVNQYVQTHRDAFDSLIPGDHRHPVGIAPVDDEEGRFTALVENDWFGTIGPMQERGTVSEDDPVQTFTAEDLLAPFSDVRHAPGMRIPEDASGVARATVERPTAQFGLQDVGAMAGVQPQEPQERWGGVQHHPQMGLGQFDSQGRWHSIDQQTQEGFEPIKDAQGNIVAQRNLATGEIISAPEALHPQDQRAAAGRLPADAQMVEYLVDTRIAPDRQAAWEMVSSSVERPRHEAIADIAGMLMDQRPGQRPEGVMAAMEEAEEIYDRIRRREVPGVAQPQQPGGMQMPQGAAPQSFPSTQEAMTAQGMVMPQQQQPAPQQQQQPPQDDVPIGDAASVPKVPSNWDVGDEADRGEPPPWANPEEAISRAHPRAGGGEWTREVQRAAPFFRKIARGEPPVRGELVEAISAARAGVLTEDAQNAVRMAAQQYAQRLQGGR